MEKKIIKKRKIRKTINKTIISLLTMITATTTVVQANTKSALYFPDNGGHILSIEELRSKNLVNPLRDYNYRYHGAYQGNKSVVEVKNIEDKFDYVKMDYITNDVKVNNLDEYQYLVIHETGNSAVGAGASNNFSAFTKSQENAQFLVDDTTVLQAMDIYSIAYAVGNTDLEKSDITNFNSLNIEMAVPSDGNYLKTVGNTVYLVRGLLERLPHLELKQHADAWSEGRNEHHAESAQKNCPEILRGETTWWTWERFVYFATNKDIPIPFVDFDPTNEKEVPSELKSYLGYEVKNNKETNKETVKEVKLASYAGEDSIFINEENSLLEFNNYSSFDTEEIIKEIKEKSKDIKLSDKELKELITLINLNSKLENVNPNVIVQLMNSYTGYLSFGGSVQEGDFNYGGLRNKKGELIKFESTEEGVISFIQYIKRLTSKSKLKLKSTNKDALKTVKKKGIVKEFTDLADALGVSNEFVEGVKNRIID